MFKQSLIKTLAVALTGLSLQAAAGVAVVVNPSVSASSTKGEVANLFLGKSNSLGGVSLTPIDQEEGSAVRDTFYQAAAQKNPSQLNAYWARVIFTGKGQPPKAVFDDAEVKDAISKDAGLVGYIDSGAVDGSVKVILTLD
jgi:hypothetical protein